MRRLRFSPPRRIPISLRFSLAPFCFFQAEDGIRDHCVTGVQTCALPISDGLRTVVQVNTDLKITGKIAQLGGGMIAEVSQKLLGQFAECLEAKLASPPSSEPPDAATPSEPSPDGTAAADQRGTGPTPPRAD